MIMSNKKYKYLFSKHETQASESFAFMPIKKSEEMEIWYERLAEMARPEKWKFSIMPEKMRDEKYPILSRYINYTFKRIIEENKLLSGTNGRVCFNTGLQTTYRKDIYALFSPNRHYDSLKPVTDYHFDGWYFEDHQKLSDFEARAELASYYDDPNDLVLDWRLAIDLNTSHIIKDNKERLPLQLQENEQLALNALDGAVNRVRQQAKRNYKISIPMFYYFNTDPGKLQLLVPLFLTGESDPPVALLLEKQKERNRYFARTILTLDMAYINARLIVHPDSDWLNP
jgi:hypothetical protein